MKSGIDYFPLECRLDDKMKLIKAEFGIAGCAIVVDLWRKIYAEEGYYCVWDSEVALLFADEERVGGNVVSEVVSSAIKRGIFDQEKYEQYGILTSKGIQTRYFEAVSRRSSVEAKSEYLCFEVAAKYKNVNISSENVYKNAENVCRNEQSKVKKSKENKSIVEDSKNTRPRAKRPTLDEVRVYVAERGNKINAEKFYDYYESNGWRVGKNPMKDWKAAVRTWEQKENEYKPQPQSDKPKSSSFDADDFFKAALRRSYQDSGLSDDEIERRVSNV